MSNEEQSDGISEGLRSSEALSLEVERKRLSPLRTYRYDAQDAIKKEDASILRIHLAERRKVEQKEYVESEENRKRIVAIILVAIIVLIVSAGALITWYMLKEKPEPEPIPIYHPTTLIEYDEVTQISGEDIASTIAEAFLAVPTTKTVYFEITNKAGIKYSLAELNATTSIRISDLLTAEISDYTFGSMNGSPFLIAKHSNKNTVLASVVASEETLERDFLSFFGISQNHKLKYINVGSAGATLRVGTRGTEEKIAYSIDNEWLVISTTKSNIDQVISARK